MTNDPHSRFQVLDVPVMAPGTCFLCRSASTGDRQYVDFGKQIDYYGAVYFCTFCFTEVAKKLGLEDKTELFKKYEDVLLKYGNEKLEVEFLQGQLNAARTLLRNCHCDDDNNVSLGDVVDVEVESESSDGESETDESGDIEGLGDVPETSSDEPKSRTSRSRKST